ncbi:MSP1 EGF domain 1 [Thalassovita gelatinovora]|uniref:MSP1 EGF domain 1 n=1 Tax=Thalassovita gelatinovora TaxID=53501 RepID=A0A0P1FBI2_THAGE|nr:MSP1 EGF domain 1 [Thalassovita gelatinovora]SER09475.1 hypothetical protein SAMN04488043_11581 [Thalassovita gelatinovora]
MDHRSGSTERHRPHSIAFQIPAETPSAGALLIGLIVAVLLLALPAFGQTADQPMPENASAKSYGDGWECNIGFRLNEDTCVAVIVPQNAYDTNRSYGSGWECLHGFRRTDEAACVAVEVPEGGFLGPSGERWRCLRGYIKVDDTCQEFVLPANAYLADASYGSTWTCERGFETTGDQCTAIEVPANAYLNGSGYGQPWTCERGFFEQAGLCEAVVIPANAYFDDASYGSGWKCDRGYAASGETCEFLNVPENAHLDRSGNRWECNKNFQKSKGLCVLNN